MENAVDALKLAFALFVFMLAFTTLFNMVSLARTTAETLITESDKTTYYTYLEEDETTLTKDSHGVISRIVTLEEMIPTIYRYSVESYGVTLVDKNGNIITRFDTDTENMCFIFDRAGTTIGEKQKLIDELNNYVLGPVNANQIGGITELRDLFERIYGQHKNNVQERSYDCFWIGNHYEEFFAQRIDSDLYGKTTYFDIHNRGINNPDTTSHNHIPAVKVNGNEKGIIEVYKDTKFKEYIVTHDKTNPIRGEEGDLFYIGENSRQPKRCCKKRNHLCGNSII